MRQRPPAPKNLNELRAIVAEHEVLRKHCIFADELAQKQLQEKLERNFGQRRHDYWADVMSENALRMKTMKDNLFLGGFHYV